MLWSRAVARSSGPDRRHLRRCNAGAMDAATAFATAEDVCYLDVREPYEWDAGHIDGSLHIPMGDIQVRVEELEKDRPIIVVCQVGQRSALVSEFLVARGFTAQNLEGGLDAWQAQGYPLVATESPMANDWGPDLTGKRPEDRID